VKIGNPGYKEAYEMVYRVEEHTRYGSRGTVVSNPNGWGLPYVAHHFEPDWDRIIPEDNEAAYAMLRTQNDAELPLPNLG
jgi:hypothetical protein